MSQKKCPYCGEFIQNNDLKCPKCFKEIPREKAVDTEYLIREEKKEKPKKASSSVVLLATIPAFFGLLGLGLMYSDHKNRSGYWFLVAGLVLFLPMLALLYMITHSGFLSAILLLVALVLLSIIYISAAVAALLETLFGSVFKVLRF